MKLVFVFLLSLFPPLYGAAKKEVTEQKESKVTHDMSHIESSLLFKALGHVFIGKGNYSHTLSKLKEFMPKLPVGGYLLIENYSNPNTSRAFNDYIGTNFILGEIICVHKDMLVWRRSDVMVQK